MKIRQIALWAMLPLSFAACNNDDTSGLENDSFVGREMQIVPSIGNMQARLGMDDVADIQAFMFRVSGTNDGKYDYYAAIKPEADAWKSFSVMSDGTVGNALQMLWASAKDPVTVSALYKADEVLPAADFAQAKFAAVQDQSTEEAFKKADYLYMPPIEALPTADNGKVSVAFSHLSAKICLELTMDYQFNELPGTQTNPVTALTIGGTSSYGVFSIDNQTWDYAAASPVEVQMNETEFTSGSGKEKKATAKYECLLLPQTISAGGFSVNITINGKTYTWTSGDDITLESNYKYALPVKVGKDYVTVGSILVSDWEAGEALPDGETDVVGNVDVWDGTIATSFAGGTGTKDDPYLIETGAQLAYLAQGTNSGSGAVPFLGAKFFALAKDIDLNNIEWTSIGYADYTWSDDAQAYTASGHSFGGAFDGRGHVISNLKMDRRNEDKGSCGLFGWIIGGTSDHSVKNLTVRNASVKGKHHVAILAGSIFASSSGDPSISNVHVSGSVYATEDYSWCGGMFGESAYVTAIGCTADVDVSGYGFTGGMVGTAFLGYFDNCTVKGVVDGTWTVGGFAGTLFYGAKAKKCVSYANVKSYDWRCGGFAGGLEGSDEGTRVVLESCSAKGNVESTCTQRVGGFGGWCLYLTATDCSFTGKMDVPSGETVAAFIGEDEGNILTKSCWYNAEDNSGLKAVGNEPVSSSSHDIKPLK